MTGEVSRADRQAVVAALPWVTRLKKSPGRCEGYRYGHMPLKARSAGMEPYRCKNAAWWRFRSLQRSWAGDGDYCWAHLFSCGLHGDQAEMDRTQRGVERAIARLGLDWPAHANR